MKTSPWNKDCIIGQKRPLQISHIWGIRIRLELEGKTRDLALFNMALDSKLRGCDLVKLQTSHAESHQSEQVLRGSHVGIEVDEREACDVNKEPRVHQLSSIF